MTTFSELVRQAYEDDPVIDADVLGKRAFVLADNSDWEDLLQQAFRNSASSFLSGISRQPLEEEPAQPVRRNRPAAPRTRLGASSRSEYYTKGFFVPAMGVRVAFKDMTRVCWESYIDRRKSTSETYLVSAGWGERAMAQLDQYQVDTSGEVPENAVRDLFESRPQDDETLD